MKTDKNFEHYFIDPKLGRNHIFKKGDSGNLIWNVNVSLAHLGYGARRLECEYTEITARGVFKLQKNTGHNNIDGNFGPGTRKLLMYELIERKGEDFFSEYLVEIRLLKMNLRRLMEEDLLRKVLEIFNNTRNEFIDPKDINIYLSNLKRLEKDFGLEMISHDDYKIGITKIKKSVLGLIHDLPDVNKC
ncbi:MAG: hypothetical protein AAF824_22250 [Bacteroidota bacterium]